MPRNASRSRSGARALGQPGRCSSRRTRLSTPASRRAAVRPRPLAALVRRPAAAAQRARRGADDARPGPGRRDLEERAHRPRRPDGARRARRATRRSRRPPRRPRDPHPAGAEVYGRARADHRRAVSAVFLRHVDAREAAVIERAMRRIREVERPDRGNPARRRELEPDARTWRETTLRAAHGAARRGAPGARPRRVRGRPGAVRARRPDRDAGGARPQPVRARRCEGLHGVVDRLRRRQRPRPGRICAAAALVGRACRGVPARGLPAYRRGDRARRRARLPPR